jgi:hypothetical protein
MAMIERAMPRRAEPNVIEDVNNVIEDVNDVNRKTSTIEDVNRQGSVTEIGVKTINVRQGGLRR